jgi:hypothetical protein
MPFYVWFHEPNVELVYRAWARMAFELHWLRTSFKRVFLLYFQIPRRRKALAEENQQMLSQSHHLCKMQIQTSLIKVVEQRKKKLKSVIDLDLNRKIGLIKTKIRPREDTNRGQYHRHDTKEPTNPGHVPSLGIQRRDRALHQSPDANLAQDPENGPVLHLDLEEEGHDQHLNAGDGALDRVLENDQTQGPNLVIRIGGLEKTEVLLEVEKNTILARNLGLRQNRKIILSKRSILNLEVEIGRVLGKRMDLIKLWKKA